MDNPIFKLLDKVLDERMFNTMFIQHEGPYYDVMLACRRYFQIEYVDNVPAAIREHWFVRPKSNKQDDYAYGPKASNFSQEVNLHVGWKHIVPCWRVRQPLLDSMFKTFQIESPDTILPMIPLSTNFRCVEVLPATSDDDRSRDYPIAFFSEADAIAAQAFMQR